MKEQYEKEFAALRGRVAEPSGLRTRVEVGHPAEHIVALAEKEKADLIVMGRRGIRRRPVDAGLCVRACAALRALPGHRHQVTPGPEVAAVSGLGYVESQAVVESTQTAASG